MSVVLVVGDVLKMSHAEIDIRQSSRIILLTDENPGGTDLWEAGDWALFV